MKKRIFTVLKYIISIFTIGILYALFVNITGIGIPCVFHLITGLKCPGCGVSRMCLSLLRLDFKKAFSYNQMIFILLPVFCVLVVIQIVRYIKYDQTKATKVQSTIYYIGIALLVVFGILRNII